MCVCVICVLHVCGCPQKPEASFGSPGAGVTGSCEPPDGTDLGPAEGGAVCSGVGLQVRSISDSPVSSGLAGIFLQGLTFN